MGKEPTYEKGRLFDEYYKKGLTFCVKSDIMGVMGKKESLLRKEHKMFGKEMNWKNWREIRDWADKHNFKNLAARMQLNNDAWNSCGEFGRCQVAIVDSLRYAEDEEEAIQMALEMDKAFAENYGLY